MAGNNAAWMGFSTPTRILPNAFGSLGEEWDSADESAAVWAALRDFASRDRRFGGL